MNRSVPDGRARLLMLLVVGGFGAAVATVLRRWNGGSAAAPVAPALGPQTPSNSAPSPAPGPDASPHPTEIPPVHVQHAVLVDGPGAPEPPPALDPGGRAGLGRIRPPTPLPPRSTPPGPTPSRPTTALPTTPMPTAPMPTPEPVSKSASRGAHQPENTGNTDTQTRKPFYGWILVAAVFFILTITSGVGFYNASIILAAATRELDASVGSVSGATGLFFAIGGLTGFVFAKRMESADLRLFYVAGGLVGAAALLGLRWVTSVAGLYVFFAFFGMAFGLAGLVPSTTLVTRWFDRRRAVALSIASTGLSVGGIVVAPVSDWIIDRQTLAGAGPYLAAIWIIGIIPVALLFVRSYPADMGLVPDGRRKPKTEISKVATAPVAATTATTAPKTTAPTTSTTAIRGLGFAEARRTRFFIALCAAYAVIFFGQVGAIAQLFNMVLERTDAPTARTSLAVLAFASVVARLVGGAVVLKLSTRMFTAALAVLQAGALVLLAVTNSSTGLILSAAFFGVSIGNLLMLQPLLLAETFGVANYGRIYSFNQLFGTIGVAGGPFALGVMRDAVDYRFAFFAAALASLIGSAAVVAAGPSAKIRAVWE